MNKKNWVMKAAQGSRLSQKDVGKEGSCFCDTAAAALERSERTQQVGGEALKRE